VAIGNKPDTKDFLLKEYEQIAAAHFADVTRETSLLQYYIALITAPLSLIAAAISLRGASILSLPDEVLNVIGVVILIVAFAGLMMMNMISHVRFEGLWYARTVNLVRRWFRDNDPDVASYLSLPVSDSFPDFFEKDRIYGLIGLAAILDAMLLGFGVWFLARGIWTPLVCAVAYFALHIIDYTLRARKRDKSFHIHFPNQKMIESNPAE
jgi:hypothetical protein